MKKSEQEHMQTVSVAKLSVGYKKEIIMSSEQRKKMAEEFSLEQIDVLKCVFDIKEVRGSKIVAAGNLKAEFPQDCVSTGQRIAQVLDTDFEIAFLPKEFSSSQAASMTDQDCEERDVIYYEGDFLPLEKAVFEQFALEIPPYPRIQDSELTILSTETDSVSDGKKDNPFHVLKKISFGS